MAVQEASNLEFFPSQMHVLQDGPDSIKNHHQRVQGYEDSLFSRIPLSTADPSYFPAGPVCDPAQPKSRLTCSLPAARRKRCIDQMPQDFPLLQIHQYQFDIDAIVFHHTKRIRYELEERQKQHTRLVVAAIGEGVAKKLREKEHQIQTIGNLNFILQERVDRLYAENQLWRDVAQTNEAAANSLLTDLENVLLANASGEDRVPTGAVAVAVAEDVGSCCGSSSDGIDPNWRHNMMMMRKCKNCGEKESCVLLLPCRHLCLCSVCGGGSRHLQACPVCYAAMNATLHVNMMSA